MEPRFYIALVDRTASDGDVGPIAPDNYITAGLGGRGEARTSVTAMSDEREIMTWEVFGSASRALAQAVADDGYEPDMVLAIARGGLLIGGAIGYALFAAIRYGYRWLRGREGMGGGDAKLFGAIGLWLGWYMLPIVLLGATLAGLAFAVALTAAGKSMSRDTRLPFGPFLALSAWLVWVAVAWNQSAPHLV